MINEFYKTRISKTQFFFSDFSDSRIFANQIPKVNYNFVDDVIWMIRKNWERKGNNFYKFPDKVERGVIMHLTKHISYTCILVCFPKIECLHTKYTLGFCYFKNNFFHLKSYLAVICFHKELCIAFALSC